MDEDKLTPAINLQVNEFPAEMSASEFQQKLYAWFEDRGLLSELRAHLRRQMISVLKQTSIGRTAAARPAISPKIQALNLLIAEFLLQQEYHYSLSVFSTEVPLVNLLPEFPYPYVNPRASEGNISSKWQFCEKDTRDILETLGVQCNSKQGQNIFNLYYRSLNKEALLTCIVRMLNATQSNGSQINIAVSDMKSDSDPWVGNVTEILKCCNLTKHNIEVILNSLKGVLNDEKKRLKQGAKEELRMVRMQVAKKEHELKKRYEALQEGLEVEKKALHTRSLSDSAQLQASIKHFKDMIGEKLHELLVREEEIKKMDQDVRNRTKLADEQQQHIEEERRHLVEVHQQLQQELKDKQEAARNDANFLKALQEECRNMKEQIDSTQAAVLNVTGGGVVGDNQQFSTDVGSSNTGQSGLTATVKQLQAENANLRALNSKQQLKMDELVQAAGLLMHEVTRTGLLAETCSVFYPAGKVNVPPAAFEWTLKAAARTHKSKKSAIPSSSSSDDFSPTTEILKEARERLKKLELEGEEVDRNFKIFRARRYSVAQSTSEENNVDYDVATKSKASEVKEAYKGEEYEKEDRPFDNQSIASSGILGDMLAAVASEVSLSSIETSDHRKDSSSDNAPDKHSS